MSCLVFSVPTLRRYGYFVLVTALLSLILVSKAPAVTVTPSVSSVSVGDTFDVTIGFESSDLVGGISFGILGDPLLVKLVGFGAGTLFDDLTSNVDYAVVSSIPTYSGYASTTYFAADQTGPAEFQKISFQALAEGTATLGWSLLAVNSTAHHPFALSAATTVEILPAAVPLPAGGLLLLTGLLGLGRYRRSRAAG